MKRKLFGLAVSLLLALCISLEMPASALAGQITFTTITPLDRYSSTSSGRDKIGEYYFWMERSGKKYVVKISDSKTGSGKVLATLSSPYQKGGKRPFAMVTGRGAVYYVTPGNVLYQAYVSTCKKKKLAALSTVMQEKLDVSNVTVRACAMYGSELYIAAADNASNSSGDETVFTYNIDSGEIGLVFKGHVLTNNGRYIVYASNDADTVYRYDMKTHEKEKILSVSSSVAVKAATANGKLYISYTNSGNSRSYIKEYTYSILAGRTLVSASAGVLKGGYIYNGYVYYTYKKDKYSNLTYNKVHILRKSSSVIKKKVYCKTQIKAKSTANFRGVS